MARIRTFPAKNAFGIALILTLILSPLAAKESPANVIAIAQLKCEYAVNPLGIDAPQPRLSWILQSNRRGAMQTAYQILVASRPELLKSDRGDLWDTGKVASDQSIHIAYAGQALKSGMRAYWKVRVWDEQGRPSPYSEPAWWEMGLLQPEDWKAQWIAFPPAKSQGAPLSLEDANWIEYSEEDAKNKTPDGGRLFRRAFELPADSKIKSARLLTTADGNFRLRVNGEWISAGGSGVSLTELKHFLAPSKNELGLMTTGNTRRVIARLVVEFENREPFALSTDADWEVSKQAQEDRASDAFKGTEWKPAQVSAEAQEKLTDARKAAQNEALNRVPMGPSPYLRKQFNIAKPVRKARLYATALGLYECYLNGRRVGQDVLAPGWTDYKKRVMYQTYDITPMLQRGDNTAGLILGDGWYAGYIGWGHQRNHYGPHPMALAQINIEYEDGTTEIIPTDPSWKGAYGPILSSDFLMGEVYDARQEIPNWCENGSSATGWHPIPEIRSPAVKLVAQRGLPVRRTQELRPKKISEPAPGRFIFDLGQNIVGWARLKVKGKAGDTVRLRYAEMLNPDGTLYTLNLRSAQSADRYTLKGGGEEIFEPRFTFHGFRYVEVTGYPGKPPLDAITGVVVHSDIPPTGSFQCSNPMVNQLQSNIDWGQRGNFLSIPTDCPQRDERLGWMGDAQIFARTACFNRDVAGFFTKWMVDVEDAQSAEGGFPDVAPRLVDMRDGAPGWGDAGVIVPWTVYQCYGDTGIIARHYEAMAKWINYIDSANPDHIWRNRVNNNFGDWVAVNSQTPKPVLSTAFFAYSTRLMAQMARAIGKMEDAKKYEELFQAIKAAFNKEFVRPDGRITGNTQTCYALALRFDLLPEDKRAAAARYLVEDIEKNGGHLTTGFLGVAHLLPALT
ncbi:MAG TPA: family 78 glycoside hydrolase catalytic domain, partial [Blastocatellia bacterium]|nr:family 78 glycoside hydrolase catalytic domain [Blastocatellia bacterium]